MAQIFNYNAGRKSLLHDTYRVRCALRTLHINVMDKS